MQKRGPRSDGSSRARNVVVTLTTSLLLVPLLAAVGSPAQAAESHVTISGYDPSQFRGVNWADQGDNFANDEVVPSGLSTSDDYATTYAKAAAIAGSFRDLGFNTIRLPVNPYSVGTDWWDSYVGAIDATTDLGMNVFLSYWDGSGTNNDGRVDDPTAWWTMWTTIVEKYNANTKVHFSPMNEPYGYAPTEWADLVADWLDSFSDVPRDRIIVSGHLYSENLSEVCADSRLDGTYLALHNYAFWNTYSYEGWIQDHYSRMAGCSHRAIFEEFGVPMTTGLDFNAPPTGSTSARNYIAFLQATTDVIRAEGMGSVYWPGLRTGDSYRLTTLAGSGTELSLAVTNQSGLDRLRWAWGGSLVEWVTVSASPSSGFAPLEVSFSVGAFDPDGSALSYSWSFGDGGSSSERNPTHSYTQPGTHEAEVTVSDGADSATHSVTIDVAPELEPEIVAQGAPQFRRVGPNRRQVQYRFRVTNVGAGPAAVVNMCANINVRRLRVNNGPRCRQVQNLLPEATRVEVFRFRIRPPARGRVAPIRFVARGSQFVNQRAPVRLRVRR